MDVINRDVENTCRVVNYQNNLDEYARIYMHSNENLGELFKCFDVKDKDVLTVLGSSDQYFYSLLNGAKRVDSFDINKLTKYYYYLRKWVIEYLDEYYPKSELLLNNQMLIKELLRIVKCKSIDEEDAYIYWSCYSNRVDDNNNLFYSSSYYRENELGSVSLLKSLINDRELSFVHMDLSCDVNIEDKYDVIITSNILEYFADNPIKLTRCRDNLRKLLKDDGIVVNSYVMDADDSDFKDMEKACFSRYFERVDFPKFKRKFYDCSFPLGCGYIKKK